MEEAYSYGDRGTLTQIYHALASWNVVEGISPIFLDGDYPTAVLHFDDGQVQNWIVVQAAPTEGGKVYVYRTIMVDSAPQPFTPAISIDVIILPAFKDVLGELEEWFLNSETIGVELPDPEKTWAEVVHGLVALL